jgi:hypothetical protein
MKYGHMATCAAVLLCAGSLVEAQERPKAAKGKGDRSKKSELILTPELQTWKLEVESWSSDRLHRAIAVEKKSIEEWARKNNFDPPGDEFDGDKNRVGRKGPAGMRVVLGKRQQAELMAQFRSRNARLKVMELVLRERENPPKDRADKKVK